MTLIPVDNNNANAIIDAAADAGDGFLGSLKLCQGDSDHVQNGEVERGGHYCYKHESGVIDLGPSVVALVLAVRAKAVDYSGEDTIVSFDPTSETYQTIAKGAGMGTGRMAGPEFLVYLPSIKEFAQLYCINSSFQALSSKIGSFLGNAAEFSAFFASNKKGKFQKPKIDAYNGDVELPEGDAIARQQQKFKEEQEQSDEMADDGGREV